MGQIKIVICDNGITFYTIYFRRVPDEKIAIFTQCFPLGKRHREKTIW